MGRKKTTFVLENFVTHGDVVAVEKELIHRINVVPTHATTSLKRFYDTLLFNIKGIEVVVHGEAHELLEENIIFHEEPSPFSITFPTPRNMGYSGRTSWDDILQIGPMCGLLELTLEEVLQVCAFSPFANGDMDVLIAMKPINGKILALSNNWKTQHIFAVREEHFKAVGHHRPVMFKMDV